jgi:hypothetical protein
MPDFSKLGYKIMAITFVKVKGTITAEEREKARTHAKNVLKEGPYEIVMGERGIGLGYDGVFISYHQSFSDYAKLKEWFRQFAFLEVDKTDSFLIDGRPNSLSPSRLYLTSPSSNYEKRERRIASVKRPSHITPL